MSNNTEEWRDVKGFEGRYQVSDRGRVKSVTRTQIKINGAPLSTRERILKQGTNRKGYRVVYPTRPGQKKASLLVHRVVLDAFVGARPNGMQCRHADGDPANNRLSNLSWATQEDNCADKVMHGTSNRGTHRSGMAKLTAEDVIAARKRHKSGEACSDIAKHYNVAECTLWQAVSGRTWRYL